MDTQIEVKYPNIKVKLTGKDGNIFAIMGCVVRAMRKARVSLEEIEAFCGQVASARSYDEALQVAMRTVNVS
jgi:hypothetical protein